AADAVEALLTGTLEAAQNTFHADGTPIEGGC
ncbi:MAG: hypothetical protein JWP11_2876, partial [Frankiales bacterium]|nr:hypothetical protein [Frankiales bacterium]